MGKIENALEKALAMKESAREAAGPDVSLGASPAPDPGPGAPPSVEGVIDTEALSEYLVSVKSPLSHVSEEYRKLTMRIFEATEKSGLNTLMITSSSKGEGKSITSINLGAAIASKIDHTVLLVDCDLRHPSLHKYLGLEPEYGLVDYLKGDVDLSDILINTGIGNMVFIPAGKPPENPSELLSSTKMRNLLREVKDRYKNRYVILDSTPLLSTAEPISLASEVDGVLMVIRERFVPRKDVLQALSLIKDANVLGVVLNRDTDQSRRYYYQY